MPDVSATQPPEGADAQDAHPWLSHYPDGVDWSMDLPARPLFSVLDDAVAGFGTHTCTNFLGKSLTYTEIGQQVAQAAAGLQKLGIKKGDRVGLLLPNCPSFIVYYYASLRLGAIVVNYNPLYTVEELADQVRDSGTVVMVTLDLKLLFDKADALLADGTLERCVVCSFPALLPGTKSVLFKLFKGRDLARPDRSASLDRITFDTALRNNDGAFTPASIDPLTDVAVIQYTGGTTGTPKGAMLTHANLYANVHQVIAWAPGLGHGAERVLGALPFFHVFAMTVVMNFAIARAAEIVIMPRFVLDDALKLISKTRPTVMPGVPTLFNAIMNHPKLASFDLSSLKFCISGGAALPVEVKTRFEALTGCKLVEGYGLSEASPVVSCNPVEGAAKSGSIGQPLPGTVISLRDLENPEMEVPRGEKGEICILGPQVMPGYWQRPDETAATFVNGALRTGDVAIMDDEGFFFIVDRIKDLIICSGYNVYPRRIEDAIYTHAAVEEVTVIGIPDDYRGEAPKAFVKLRKGETLTTDELMTHLEVKLSKIELPSEIEFRTELPKTMIGKLSKKELRQEEAQRQQSPA
ncbi:MAG: long-chain fatty acid--CoA ligase [Pseudomonadota bacterium]